MHKERLMIPGPTSVPPEVYRALQEPVFGHRGPTMPEVYFSARDAVQQVFQTDSELFILAASGTGAMEAAVLNLTEPGDRVLVTVMGAFGRRFAQIAEAHGCRVDRLDTEWGSVVRPEDLASRLEGPGGDAYRAVIVTHNETSTAVTVDLEGMGRVMSNHPGFLVVDAVSSMGAIDLQTDAWGVDVVCTSSQKALMIPPGLAFTSVSRRALRRAEDNVRGRFYFDWFKYREYADRGHTPFTPAISLMRAAAAACCLILDEGLQQVFARHRLLRDMVREGARAVGVPPLVPADYASNSVTSLVVPEGIEAGALQQHLLESFGIAIAGGKGPLAGKIVRIGHMGYTDTSDVLQTLAALEASLQALGHELEPGAAVAAATKVLQSSKS